MGRLATATVGLRAERLALDYLLARGLVAITRNFRCRGGEIDLIMLDGDCLVFIEVRYRATAVFSPASHTVDRHKQRKIVRSAAMFNARNHRYAMHTMRFDVVAVEGEEKPTIDWITDAFRPKDSTC